MTTRAHAFADAFIADELRVTVVVPTYNEVDNIASLTEELLRLPLPGLRVLIVDDNSPDGTGDVAEQLAAQHAQISVIHRAGKGGLGTAYVAGMSRALADGAEYVVQMDADFSHQPAYILQMLGVTLATAADVVVGSRYVPGGSLDEGWSLWRRFLSWFANIYVRLILRLRTRDMTAGFKLWKRSALLGLGLERIRSNGYSFQVEMAYLCEKLNYHIIEIPIHFEDRRIGQSKLDVPVKFESGWRTWQIRWRYRGLKSGDGRMGITDEGGAMRLPTTSHPQVTPPKSQIPNP